MTHEQHIRQNERRRSGRHWMAAALAAVVAALMVPAVLVYACVGLVALNASPASVQPGGSVTLKGMDFVPTAPVLIHLDTIDGPVIATVTQMTGGVMSSRFTQTVNVPPNVSTGQHLLIATQNVHNMNGGNPARTILYVGVAAPGPATPEARPAAATLDTGPGWGILALIALGAAIVGFIVFGYFVLRPRRTPPAPAGAA
jgi:hypothetical protein